MVFVCWKLNLHFKLECRNILIMLPEWLFKLTKYIDSAKKKISEILMQKLYNRLRF